MEKQNVDAGSENISSSEEEDVMMETFLLPFEASSIVHVSAGKILGCDHRRLFEFLWGGRES